MANEYEDDDPDDADLVPVCATCEGCKKYGALIAVRCLGCMNNFMRCANCYHTATACSDPCKEAHRKKLAIFFGPGAPKIGGAGDVNL